jgi:hypothetical protein
LALDEGDESRGIDPRTGRKADAAVFGPGLNLRDAEPLGRELDRGDREQRFRRRRQEAEAVDELDLECVQVGLGARVCDAFVMHEPHVHVGHVVLGYQGGQADELDLGTVCERILDVGLAAFAQGRHGAAQKLVVEREADRLNLAALAFAEQLARAADLEVVRGEREARTELLERLDGLEPFRRVGCERAHGRRDHVGVGLVVRAAHAAAQLMQLREAEPIRTIDDDGVCGGDVDAALDDRRADEHVEVAMVEREHDLLERALRHLSMRDADLRFRQELLEIARDALDVLDAVVHEVHLAAAAQLA